MDDIQANFTYEENEPINATFEAYDEPPTIEIISNDYNDITNKPSINDVELVGNKTAEELGLALASDIPDLTDYVKNTDYASASVAGVVKFNSIYGSGVLGSGVVTTVKSTDDEVVAKTQKYRPIVPANLDLAVKTGVTTNTIELTDDEKVSARTWLGAVGDTDYVTTSKAGIVTVGVHYGTQILNTQGLIGASTRTLELYNSAPTSLLVGKGTLDNVLTQYSKTVLTTEADYNALETKDANTLYLIEE